MATSLSSTISEEEYLHLERLASEKSEYLAGQVVAMFGGTYNHSVLATRMAVILDRQADSDCGVFNSDRRVYIPLVKAFTYPDGGVVCGQPQFSSDEQDVLMNPILLVEVLSTSSAAYDRGKKFQIYEKIQSLREYLLVHQDRRCVERYSRQPDGHWQMREHSGDQSLVVVDCPKLEIAIAELYARTAIAP